MLLKLLLIFTLVPLIEVWLLVRVGQNIGAVPTVIIVAITGFVGVFLAKSQGLITITKIQRKLARGSFPTDELYNGACILVGGALLLTPGIMTDAFGISLIIPLTRFFWKSFFYGTIKKMMQKGTLNVYYSGHNFSNSPEYYDADFDVIADDEPEDGDETNSRR